jgi:response regulator RpfG family c-di-GMP phosphodiesterase
MSEPTPARVLVVADNPETIGALERAFSEAGWVVQTASDGPAAVAACERTSFALTLISLQLPGMSGSELAAVLAHRWPDIAVIIISGAEDLVNGASYLHAGADDHVLMPFHGAELVIRADRALERHRLLLGEQEHKRELNAQARRESHSVRHLLLGTMKSLSYALEAKDPYTRGHSERVSRLAKTIASSVGATGEELDRMELAGQVHDLGKIGIRESVLSKPGKLSEEEYLHVQAHPVIAERILAPVVMNVEVAAMVRHHHEHYAGGGYPDGLRGSAIPLGARVLAVADAFDALTSDRPYRARLTKEVAFGVLRAGTGTQWQPALVEALIGYLEERNHNNASR